MKIKGIRVSAVNHGSLTLVKKSGEDITLQFRSLPLNFTDEVNKEIPSPIPKTTDYLKDRRGRPVRDPDTGKPIMLTDEDSPEFKQSLSKANRRQTTLMLFEALKEDSAVEFENKREDFPSISAWADAIYEELNTAGFSVGDLAAMISFMMELSNIKEEELEEARADFLP